MSIISMFGRLKKKMESLVSIFWCQGLRCLRMFGLKKKKESSLQSLVDDLESDDMLPAKLRSHPKIHFTPPFPLPLIFTGSEPANKPVSETITITNKSAKFAAYKVMSSDPSLFRAHPPCGIVPAGGTKTVNIRYHYPTELTAHEDIRIFVSLVDTAVLPVEFQEKKTNPPSKYDGEHFIRVLYVGAPNVPGEVEILPHNKTPLLYLMEEVGKDHESRWVRIRNTHPTKYLAWKVVPTAEEVFTIDHGIPAGVLHPGTHSEVLCCYHNKKKEPPIYFFTFTRFIDLDELPDDFKRRIDPAPIVFDGVQINPLIFIYGATEDEVASEYEREKKYRAWPGSPDSIICTY